MNALHHVPVWVWPLLLLLIAIGLRQSRTLRMPKRRLVIIPAAWTVFALISLSQLPYPLHLRIAAVGVWALCNVLFSLLARPLFAPAVCHEAHHITVPGSWAPLALYLLIFSLRFVNGMLSALQPELMQQSAALMVLSTLMGMLSGLINARSLRLLQAPVPAV